MKRNLFFLILWLLVGAELSAQQTKPQAKPQAKQTQSKPQAKKELECKCKDQTFKYEGKKYLSSQIPNSNFRTDYFALLKNDTVYFTSIGIKTEGGNEIVTKFESSKMAVKDFANGQLNSEVSINIKKTSNFYALTLAPEAFNFKKNAIIQKIDMCDISPNPTLRTGRDTFIIGYFEKEEDAKSFLSEVEKVMNKYKSK